MTAAGFTPKNAAQIQQEVARFEKMRDEVKLASGDYVDMKRYEPAMRQLLDMYIRADDSLNALPDDIKKDEVAMAETIENNMRKTIVDENPVNPKYYEQMSAFVCFIRSADRRASSTGN